MLSSAMTLAGPLADPGPADMQYEYIIWDILCRRALLWAIAEHMGVTIVPSTPAEPADTRSQIVWQVLAATVGRRSEEHTSELPSLMRISYAVFCVTKKHTPHYSTPQNLSSPHTSLTPLSYIVYN